MNPIPPHPPTAPLIPSEESYLYVDTSTGEEKTDREKKDEGKERKEEKGKKERGNIFLQTWAWQ